MPRGAQEVQGKVPPGEQEGPRSLLQARSVLTGSQRDAICSGVLRGPLSDGCLPASVVGHPLVRMERDREDTASKLRVLREAEAGEEKDPGQ